MHRFRNRGRDCGRVISDTNRSQADRPRRRDELLALTETHSTSSSGAAAGKGGVLGEKRLPFLATKVVPPRCPGLIERPRLVDATSQLSEKRLAVVKGPAGFGKTSLAVTWLQRLQQSGNAVAWLTIDTDDDEPAIFLFYLAHALHHACEGGGRGRD